MDKPNGRNDITGLMRGFASKDGSTLPDGAEPDIVSKTSPHWLSRRDFLQWMGAITTLLSSEACMREPLHKILPYSKAPEEVIPGKPNWYATTVMMGGAATGLLVESHQGRPTKIEGNPSHPASLGATDAFAQAAIIGLYDPDRSELIRKGENIATWSGFSADAGRAMSRQSLNGERACGF